MTNEKKKSKGPQDRNSNYQMKNGNSLSKKNKKSKQASPVRRNLSPRQSPESRRA